MTIMVPVAMFGWIPFTILLFTWFPPRRAAVIAFVTGWMFLPNYEYVFEGFPDYTKTSAICTSILLAALIFDPERVHTFRFSRWDLPMLFWCFSPLPSSLSNDLGFYDGLASSLDICIKYGFPYYIGRIYFTNGRALHELALAVFLGGMAYVPLCIWEMRMSPQLHRQLYGFHQHDFLMTIRMGGYRPMVFMDHGLMVGMWMTAACLCGVWLWRAGALKRWRSIPPGLWIAILLATTLFVRSTGAIFLLIMGLCSLWFASKFRTTLPMLALIILPLVYIGFRSTNVWDGRELVGSVSKWNLERAASLWFRFENEIMLADKAMEQPIFGWGGYGRARVYDEETGEDLTVTDSQWIIVFGNHGLWGFVNLTLAFMLPIFLLWRYYPPSRWGEPRLAPASALAMILVLFMIDNLVNDMMTPLYGLIAGALTGFYVTRGGEPPHTIHPIRVL